jgi:DNA ligase-1
VVLDGELWEGRGLFQQTVGKVRTQFNPDWTGVEYVIFDLIADGPFEERLERLKALQLPSHARVLNQVRCSSQRHLQELMISIIDMGGEGIMLRLPGSLYEHKRSGSLLKVKEFQTEEAVVTGYEKGKGKYEGLVGALLCRFREKIIEIGTGLTDELRQKPPAIDREITFKYFELTENGMPRFPVFLAMRDYE